MNEHDALRAAMPYIDKLAAFDTADEIGKFLGAEGITGRIAKSTHCVIAEYIYQGIGQRVEVQTTSLVFRSALQSEFVFHSDAMKEFICEFDEGGYPELEWCVPDDWDEQELVTT